MSLESLGEVGEFVCDVVRHHSEEESGEEHGFWYKMMRRRMKTGGRSISEADFDVDSDENALVKLRSLIPEDENERLGFLTKMMEHRSGSVFEVRYHAIPEVSEYERIKNPGITKEPIRRSLVSPRVWLA